MSYKFYKRERKEIVPVADESLNQRAEELLATWLSDTTLNIPSWVKNAQQKAVFQSVGNLEKANAIYILDSVCFLTKRTRSGK